MEYALVFLFQFLGIGFNVMQKIVALGDTYPQLSMREAIVAFFKKDWDTLAISSLVLAFNLAVHFVANYYKAPFTAWVYYPFVSFGIALVLGYGGQRMIYKYLGTAESYLDKKVTDNLK